MRRYTPIALALVVLGGPAAACLNDRDTSSQTVRRLPAVVDVIAGRFARNIPLYYEMRLDRVASEIGSDPAALDLYDDAAVAADRLGRYDEAIGWMERKRARLEALPGHGADLKEAWYRYHANVGTHWVHRWIKRGADRSRLDELRTARDHIAKAIEIKPNAHFGREKFQLQAIEWLIRGPELIPEPITTHPPSRQLPLFIDTRWTGSLDPESTAEGPDEVVVSPVEAVEGLCGLIVLGNAWESVDAFLALAAALEDLGEPGLALMARLRCEELIDAGRGSLVPGTPTGEELKALLGPRGVDYEDRAPSTSQHLRVRFVTLRREAESLNERRAAFLRERLEAGRHPDTDPSFWEGGPADVLALRVEDSPEVRRVVGEGYSPPTEEELYDYGFFNPAPGSPRARILVAGIVILVLLGVSSPFLAFFLVRAWLRRPRRKPAPTKSEDPLLA
jgi:hypothetical protein